MENNKSLTIKMPTEPGPVSNVQPTKDELVEIALQRHTEKAEYRKETEGAALKEQIQQKENRITEIEKHVCLETAKELGLKIELRKSSCHLTGYNSSDEGHVRYFGKMRLQVVFNKIPVEIHVNPSDCKLRHGFKEEVEEVCGLKNDIYQLQVKINNINKLMSENTIYCMKKHLYKTIIASEDLRRVALQEAILKDDEYCKALDTAINSFEGIK